MRALLWQDIVAAARVAALLPEPDRVAALIGILHDAHAADKYRKATGRADPRRGDGTLAAALRHLPRAPVPVRGDPAHCAVLMAVLQAVACWRAQRDWRPRQCDKQQAGAGPPSLQKCDPLWNGRAACTTLGALQEAAHDHRPPTPHRDL